MELQQLAIRALGLKRSDVDTYISNLISGHKKTLSALLHEKKMLQRTKHRLVLELTDLQQGQIIYEDEEAPAPVTQPPPRDVSDKSVKKTISLIRHLADKKVEDMIRRAKEEVLRYDVRLEELQQEIEANREKTEQLLSQVIHVLKSNIDEVFSDEGQKPSVKKEQPVDIEPHSPKEKPKVVELMPKEMESKIIGGLKAYGSIQNEFQGALSRILAGDSAAKGAVLLVEINNYLIANYFTKSQQEDDLMTDVTRRISELSGRLSIVRLSYDQIGIIYNGVNDTTAVSALAHAILAQIQMYSDEIEDTASELSANIGIALYPQNAVDGKTIMNCAGIALYKSKERGKGVYEFINDELIREVKMTSEFRHDLIEAIKNDELALQYQPQYSAEDGSLKGFEALLRWENEKYEQIPIQHVIQTAEKEDLMAETGAYVFRKACLFAKKVKAEGGRRIVVSVNFSNSQIEKADFIETVQGILKETGADPRYMGFEVTESYFASCFDDNCTKIQQIKDMGVTIMIDDFGTGYSTLSYLVRLPVSVVKIDKSFLDGMIESERNANFISSVIDITHDLGMKVIAEGVEHQHQLQLLTAMGCDYFQGFLLSRPLSEKDALALI